MPLSYVYCYKFATVFREITPCFVIPLIIQDKKRKSL